MSLVPFVIGAFDAIKAFIYASGDNMVSDLGYTLDVTVHLH